jgi:Cobalamin-5-phosphate synthase
MFIRSLIIAFSMYSKFPMPKCKWEDKSMKYVFCFFPFIGAVLGGISVVIYTLLSKYDIGIGLIAAIMTALPIVITGGIHMDGFLDTVDAISSYKSREEKLEILKDPHAGAFAILFGALYLVVTYGAWTEVKISNISIIAQGYILSRCFSAISVICFPSAKKAGTVADFKKKSSAKAVSILLIVMTLTVSILMAIIGGLLGVISVLSALLVFVYYYFMSKKEFGGITGDLAGWFLQITELVILLVVAIFGRVN